MSYAEAKARYAAFNREKCIPLMDNGHYPPHGGGQR